MASLADLSCSYILQVYNHWGPVDEHKTLPAERLNELFGSMATYYRPPTEEVILSCPHPDEVLHGLVCWAVCQKIGFLQQTGLVSSL